jgi:hypothetical protein
MGMGMGRGCFDSQRGNAESKHLVRSPSPDWYDVGDPVTLKQNG